MSAPPLTDSLAALVADWGRQQYPGRPLDEAAYRAAEAACGGIPAAPPLAGEERDDARD